MQSMKLLQLMETFPGIAYCLSAIHTRKLSQRLLLRTINSPKFLNNYFVTSDGIEKPIRLTKLVYRISAIPNRSVNRCKNEPVAEVKESYRIKTVGVSRLAAYKK